MKYLPLSLADPAGNLALDEALLELAEDAGVATLRIWEAPAPFVVLGLSNHVGQEVRCNECAVRGVPILRRVSGGGTVVQGPGCLSYALTMRIESTGATRSIPATNRFVMERNRTALEALLGASVSVRGHTDLETGGRKFSGNAQRRGRRALLFHGTILYAANLRLIDQLLQHPSREPDWRERRPHQEFIGNIAASREQIATALRQAWGADAPATFNPASERLKSMVAKHSDPAWVHRLP